MVGTRDAKSDATCRHMSAHVGMSKCAATCQHADKVQRVRIRDAECDGTYWHMSAHISTCRHISAHVDMSNCADTCQQHASTQRSSEGFVSDMPRVMVHIGTCRHISAHVRSYQHMSACPNVLTHASLELGSK